MNKSKLHIRLLAVLFLFAFFTILFTATWISREYEEMKDSENAELIYTYCRTGANLIDGDQIAKYVDTRTTDHYYDEIQNYLDSVMLATEPGDTIKIRYYYVAIPRQYDYYIIWDGYNPTMQNVLGDTIVYDSEDVEAKMKAAMSIDPPMELAVYDDDRFGSLVCGYYPVYDSGNDPVAVVCMDVSVPEIRAKQKAYTNSLINIILAVTVVLGALVYYVMRRGIVEPLWKLNIAAKELVNNLDNKEQTVIDINTGDELEELANSFNKMNVDLHEYIDRLNDITTEREKILAELNVATDIQKGMMPLAESLGSRKEFDLAALMDPALEVGGDFYDFFMIDKDHICLVMADVSGKGVPAALFMVITKTLIKNRAMTGVGPSRILKDVNNQLCAENDSRMFVTVWLAIIDVTTGKGIAANAGHEHPVLRHEGGKYELVVYPHSPVLGMVEDLTFREHEFKLEKGDRLFVFTDGVTEAMNITRDMYGVDRMLETMNAHPDDTPDELLKDLRADIAGFIDTAAQFDDITMLCFDYHGPESQTVIELDATMENLDNVMDALNEYLDTHGCPKKLKMGIDLTVEELYVNVANYAYTPEIGKVKIVLSDLEEEPGIRIVFIDHGIPYDPLAKPDPDITLPADERPIGGLGIYLVKKNMDTVEYTYSENANILTLTKKYGETDQTA